MFTDAISVSVAESKMSKGADKMETNEVNLLDFPDEILLVIFSHLTDTALVHVTRVCQRFKPLAEDAFSKKYSGSTKDRYYVSKVFCESLVEEQTQHWSMFCTFGACMQAIKIIFYTGCRDEELPRVAKNHWLFRLIQRRCKSITKVIIENNGSVDITNIIIHLIPSLTDLCLNYLTLTNNEWTKYTYPRLVHFKATYVGFMDVPDIANFLNLNPQIEKLKLDECENIQLSLIDTMSDKLNQLKTLHLAPPDEKLEYIGDSTIFKFDGLESLHIAVAANSFVNVLTAFRNGCKNIKCLKVSNGKWGKCQSLDLKYLNVICSFDMLETLELEHYHLEVQLIEVIVSRLPNLVSLKIFRVTNISSTEEFMSVVLICKNLTYLELFADLEFNFDLFTRVCDIIRSAGRNMKLVLQNWRGTTIITHEDARRKSNTFADPLEYSVLYWKGYDASYTQSNKSLLDLNNNCLTRIIALLDANSLHTLYRTNTLLQQLVKTYVLNNVFYVSTLDKILEDVYRDLGENIRYIKAFDQCLEKVNKYCVNLNEMELCDIVKIESLLYWPNLKKLKLNVSFVQVLSLTLFQCPELTHLEINPHRDSLANVEFTFDSMRSFHNLTNIQFKCYDEKVEQFLFGLSPKICCQLKTLSLGCWMYENKWVQKNKSKCWINLINIITQCRELTELHLYIAGFEVSNFEFLYENCCKLMTLSIVYSGSMNTWPKIFQNMKQNLQQIQIINLIDKDEYTFACEYFLKMVYTFFPENKVNLISPEVLRFGNTISKLNKKNYLALLN